MGAQWPLLRATFGIDGQTKNRQSRVVDFNERLKAHLLEMSKRQQPDYETHWGP